VIADRSGPLRFPITRVRSRLYPSMKTQTSHRIHLVTLGTSALLAAAGCASEPDLDLGCAGQALLAFNAMSLNAMTANALAYNALAMNALAFNSLSLEETTIDAAEDCQASHALQLMQYTVGCALGPDQEVTMLLDGAERRLRGQMGLAPEWAEQPCDETCQGWVSACLIARINARGERVEISMRGDHPALAVDRGEAAAFRHEEASYYGSVFAVPIQLNACLPQSNRELDRVCGEADDCPVQIAGDCAELCNDSGCLDEAGQRRAEVVRIFRDAL
jgi:hypothetical protein